MVYSQVVNFPYQSQDLLNLLLHHFVITSSAGMPGGKVFGAQNISCQWIILYMTLSSCVVISNKHPEKYLLTWVHASLSFHGGGAPAISLLELYENFGFHFDHIFAFEITYTEPKEVFGKLLPDKYFASYWINTGVSSGDGDKLNPLQSVLQKFSEDDLIIVKLDIDTASIELPLVKQLLEGGPSGIYHQIVDQFYFEHHVHLGEIAKWWSATGDGMEGTIKESLEMFHGLRKNGIPAHYWP